MTCEVKVKEWSLAALVEPSFQSGDWNRDADADRGPACAVTGPAFDGVTVRGVASFWSALSWAKSASAW